MAVSGSLLLYKNELLTLFYPQLDLSQPLPTSVSAGIADKHSSGYALMPTEGRPWFEIVDADKTHYYYGTDGQLILQRAYLSDVISWLVALHHHLALDELGKDILGVLGLLSLLLVTTGIVRWWPRRGSFRRSLSVRWTNPSRAGACRHFGNCIVALERCYFCRCSLPLLLVRLSCTQRR